ncbi:MAG: MBL fold metallo-hydrolase, partial [Chloroflexi bacterium]|nr:MBL fold metallo-hydrolase [Chloroflexota bacterium]
DVKPDRRNRIRLGLNCLLVQTPETNILIDTGAGSKRTEKFKDLYNLNGNKLLRGLRALGLTARDIDIVILTQLQFDHGGGCTKLDRSGSAIPTFPKAQYMVQRSCYEEARSPNERFKGSFYEDDFVPLEEKGVLTLLDGDTEVTPGVTVKVANGPFRGHQTVMIERGSERIAYVADLIPTAHHLPLHYISALDEAPDATLVEKRKMLKMATEGGWLMIFGHGYEQPSGYVQQRNGKATLTPIEI